MGFLRTQNPFPPPTALRSWAAGLLLLLLPLSRASALPATTTTKRAAYKHVQTTTYGGVAFGLGNVTYLANVGHPAAVLSGDCSAAAATAASSLVPLTVIFADEETVTGAYLEGVVARYLEGDDVFAEDFLEGVLIAYNGTSAGSASLDDSAMEYLNSFEPKHLFLDASFESGCAYSSDATISFVAGLSGVDLPAGPYAASVSDSFISLGAVYRLYRDAYRDFMYGTYATNDGQGTFSPVELFESRFWDPLIPVPSRIYAWADPRPLAGLRVAIKDLFDMKGLVTSGGSQAWAEIAEVANETAPSIQRIADLGGVLVGKYKLAQFASGADPWGWQDEQYPFNPRGDGWLTCSASSSGGGCAVAAYDWLDFAIGSDTGSSMRRPAAVSGTYGNRPSQGLVTLRRVMPLGAATDTAGVFGRDPRTWARFARHWYAPELHEDPAVTGLSPLEAPADGPGFPKRLLYLTDYLPLANPAAEAVLQGFIGDAARVLGLAVEKVNLTAVVAATDETVPKYGALSNATGVLNRMTQWEAVAKPLLAAWAERHGGRFPPIDPARRPGWQAYDESFYTAARYADALATKRAAADWFEREVLYATPGSCSESVMVWDIGTGGLPSYRERALVEAAGPGKAAFLAATPEGAGISGANLCPIYGCVDMTVPIGQVPYRSDVTLAEEMVPVTVSVVARRGCDFMLWDMFEKLADEGVLKTVKTGRTAF